MSRLPRVITRVPGARTHSQPCARHQVDVIIPNYNYARFLPGAIQSALSQPGVDVKVLVVDDASTDESVSVARSISEKDERVSVIEHSTNLGPVATFNDGLAVVSGEYVVRLDADDLLTPGSLGRATALAENFPTVGLVYGHPIHFHRTLPPHRSSVRRWTIWKGESWLELRCRLGVNCITSPEVLMRSSVIRAVGGQRDLAHAHDMEMWLRIARYADVGHVSGSDQAWHREHERSLSAREVDVMTDLRERAAAFRLLFEDSSTEAVKLWEVARTALAKEAVARAIAAIVRGRAETPEPENYMRFARSMDVGLGRSYRLAERALNGNVRCGTLRLGLVWRAAYFRLSRKRLGARWRSTGL